MFFKNAKTMLSRIGEIHVTQKEKNPYNRWKLEKQAQKCGLVLKESVTFDLADYLGYTNRRGDGLDIGNAFFLGSCKTYKFIPGVERALSVCASVGIQGIAWAFGGMIFALIYCTAGISGGHINPCVTFGIGKGFQESEYQLFGGGANTVAHGYTKGDGLRLRLWVLLLSFIPFSLLPMSDIHIMINKSIAASGFSPHRFCNVLGTLSNHSYYWNWHQPSKKSGSCHYLHNKKHAWDGQASFLNVIFGVSLRGERVVTLNLIDMGLEGSISPFLSNLSFLQSIDLSNNTLYGHIPHQSGRLSGLKELRLHANRFEDHIPSTVNSCHNLIELALSYNSLSGSIPTELGFLPHLKLLYLGQNNLTGGLRREKSGVNWQQWRLNPFSEQNFAQQKVLDRIFAAKNVKIVGCWRY
eukprot:Gb_41122 [translate_table: standard]